MIKNILVATDGSAAANRAVDLAADMAARYECSLSILNVVRHMQLPPELLKMAKVENLSEGRGYAQVSRRVSLDQRC